MLKWWDITEQGLLRLVELQYQGYSIHGNEPSGANAALLVAYYLAAAEGTDITELLDNTISIPRFGNLQHRYRKICNHQRSRN